MKKGIHPTNYRPVVFMDISADYKFLTRSSVQTQDTIEWEDGNTYPLVKLEISDKSHPFFTGKQVMLDSTGRVDRFNKKYGLKNK
ncbi:MAG: 50S ribosomal protein L31 [Ignavibacteriae bacterium HGW-Ignavibacteriae-2]|jgi:large subunit ribosomal protein L31|nr:type B 50S ribosomal protein L31 [Bacteroidota bacterium]PKL87866.1 MAG: 50S ribosomal protein L31 [Ignavibacteriae bacterium HGW-Ignavibacteriae-2]